MNQTTIVQGKMHFFFLFTAFFLGFAFPISVALTNVGFILVLLCLFLKRDASPIKDYLFHPIVYVPIFMYLLLSISAFVFPHNYSSQILIKYIKLLYILPFGLFFHQGNRITKTFFQGFLVANVFILLLSYMVSIFNYPFFKATSEDPTLFIDHITQNFFMAITAIFFLAFAYDSQGWKRIFYLFISLLVSYNVLFLVPGRTGYLALFVGTFIFLFLMPKIKSNIIFYFFGLLLVSFIFIPNKGIDNIKTGLNQIRICQFNKNEILSDSCNHSLGQRKTFVKESIKLIHQSPILGNGAGAFNFVDAEKKTYFNNPHNQYLLEMLQTGIYGLILLLLWFGFIFYYSMKLPFFLKLIIVPVIFCYFSGNFFNSLLLDFSESSLFSIIAAIIVCYSVNHKFSTYSEPKKFFSSEK